MRAPDGGTATTRDLLGRGHEERARGIPPRLKTRSIRPEEPYTVRVVRQGESREVRLAPRLATRLDELARNLSIFVISLTWFAVATVVAVLKPDSGIARLAYAAGITQAL